jgi:membrane associated rhomboid family serine protease
MLPIGDDNPTIRTPVMTLGIIAVTLVVWFQVQGAGDPLPLVRSVCNYGLVPGELTHLARLGSGVPIAPGLACVVDNDPINWLTPVLSIFLHGSWGHLLGNLWFFWIFGNNVEDSMGRLRFVFFYLLCGLAAAASHILAQPASPVPTVGASGAISGIMGAYLLLYPHARVRMFFVIFIVRVRAWIVLLYWFGTQVLSALPGLSTVRTDVSAGVAVWAHVGGFIAGALLIRVFENPTLVRRRTAGGDANAVWGAEG